MKKIFVIIVTYKGKYWYDRCFQSLRASTYPVTTIVVDNNSGDDSVAYIRANYPEVIVFENKENLGFGRANNVGMKYARENGCDYVFLLNQDAWLDSDAIEELVKVSEEYTNYGVLVPVFLNKERNQIGMSMGTEISDVGHNIVTDIYCGNPLAKVYKCNYCVQAAGWMITRKTLDTIGGFTPLIFHYGEDDDYMNRLKFHGVQMGIVPAARMVHDHSFVIDRSKDFFDQSNLYVPEDYININISTSVWGYLSHYLYLAIKNIIKRNVRLRDLCLIRVKYIWQHRKDIKYSKGQNLKQQPNWIQ